jgi:hypothetical protein
MLTPILSDLAKVPSRVSSADAETTPPEHCMLAVETVLVLSLLLPVRVKEHVAGLVLLPLADTTASRRPASMLQRRSHRIRASGQRKF